MTFGTRRAFECIADPCSFSALRRITVAVHDARGGAGGGVASDLITLKR
jgi:hypothetical protein